MTSFGKIVATHTTAVTFAERSANGLRTRSRTYLPVGRMPSPSWAQCSDDFYPVLSQKLIEQTQQ